MDGYEENKSVIEDGSLFIGDDVLILGNGFDLDLGLKTSYRDYYNSKYWPFNNPYTKMGDYLNGERLLNEWMDLEEKLGDYSCNATNITWVSKRNDKEDYSQLITGLESYLSKAENGAIKTKSTAAKVLIAYLNSYSIPRIFSFNYTNLYKIARRLGISTEFSYEHIHGSLENHNIILGVGENYKGNAIKLPEDMDFVYKTSSPNYQPPQMADVLSNTKHVTFFGLSIGGMDAPYFSGLFQNLSAQKDKIITFITYNEESRLQILRHLRNIQSINLNDIWTRHKIEFIRTASKEDAEKVNEYIKRLNINPWNLDLP